MTVDQAPRTSTPFSRRAALGMLAAATIVPGSNREDDGYGPPLATKGDKTDPKEIRANLALWLLLSTCDRFFTINYDASGAGTMSCFPDMTQLISDLKYLPGKTNVEQTEYVTSVVAWLNSRAPHAKPGFRGDRKDFTKNDDVDYLAALWNVRILFNMIAQGDLSAQHTGIYHPGGPECPLGSTEVLSLATEHPTAIVP